jgi:PAS domain S-box-containing protein
VGTLVKRIVDNNFLKIPLLRNILLVSLTLAIVLPLYIIFLIYPSFTQLLIDDKRDDAIRIARHLSSMLVTEKAELQKNVLQIYILDGVQKLKEIRDDFELIKLKFFSKSGEIIFSTDPEDIGKINKERYFHEIVAKGKVHAEVVQKDTESLEGQKVSADVVETYVPLMSDSKFLGAFEIYYDITARKEQLSALLSRSSTILVTLASGLLLIIVITLIRENKTITERERVECALRKSEQRFRETTDLLPTVICETNTDMTITYLNKAGFEIFGYSQADLGANIKIIELIHPDDRGRAAQEVDEILEGAELVATEYRMLREDGSVVAVFVNFAPLYKEGKVTGMRAGIADITEQKNLQARLQEAQKMEAIGTLAGGIAHQFNNALGAIIPNIDLLRMKYPEDKRINRCVQPMYNSAQRMAQLTSQLLAYARGGKYWPQHISLRTFVLDTLPLIKHSIKTEIHVHTDLPDDAGSVEADLTQLQMLLLAVVVNASEAIQGEGHIRITTRSEEIDEEFAKDHPDLRPGPYECLTIEDNGRGMDEETKSRVFEPFFTTKFTGRGLGMAAVYGIVKNHDGLVLVDSELGKGTVVDIYLPAMGDPKGERNENDLANHERMEAFK